MTPIYDSDFLAHFDLAAFAGELPAKLSKDERRVRLFVAAVGTAVPRIAFEGTDKLFVFLLEAGVLAQSYIKALNPKKWSFATIFGDPLKGPREEVRAFAKRWKLDPKFIEEMG